MNFRALLLPAIALVGASANAASFYNDFSTLNNDYSNGWLLGTTSTAGGTVTPFADYTAVGGDGISRWSNLATETALVPAAFKNSQVADSHGILLGEAALHGGIDGTIAVASYKFATAGAYAITGAFGDGDSGSVDLYITSGANTYLSSLNVSGNQAFSFILNATAGQTIEFAVGTAGAFGSDSTPLSANIDAVPEPASMAALGLGGLALLRRRRKA
ncbi:PEP-CTERM sorting domain-containing protein [bacterium]|nr:MAG: PEP-CTERM sorting domain-containing protein [bacterium]